MSTTAATSLTSEPSCGIRTAVLADGEAIFVLLEQLAVSHVPEREAFTVALVNALNHPHDHLLLVAVDAAPRADSQ